jgi:hypothetical protein
MILTFRNLNASQVSEPTDWVELRGLEIYISTRPDPVARYVSDQWIYNGVASTYIQFDAMVSVHFEDPARSERTILGPYYGMRIRDRYLFGGRIRVATLWPKAENWLHYRTMENWRVVRMIPDNPPPQTSL